jgi:hypothetical protein
MYEYYFDATKRKPSNAQVLKQINKAINEGHNYIEIIWGENMITIERMHSKYWYGSGWIRNISGSDLAVKINNAIYGQQEQFIKDRFQFISVGF